jgi:arginyl-tRNA--protein-N-Asp/Glu arginylyltransferase
MAYKANFRPVEALLQGRWTPLEAPRPAAAETIDTPAVEFPMFRRTD